MNCQLLLRNLDRSLLAFFGLLILATALHIPAIAAADELPPHMLEMEAALSHQKVMIAEPQELHAVIDLKALQAEVEERPPMNLALVIDRSGSMRGSRIEQARKAALHVVDSLDEGDRLALVTYGGNHTVEFDSTLITEYNRKPLRDTIRAIEAQGGTNLSAGYKAGTEIVARHHDENAINRILMLSDGKANQGITDPNRLRSLSRQAFDDGISTSTIGFGLDYNERLMTGMAVEGSGHYYFADDSDDLGALVAREMAGLSATVANRIEVIIDPGPGVEIAEIIGFSHRFRDGKAVVSVSELGAGQSRSMVIRLNAVPQQPDVMDVLTVRANYRDTINDRHRYRRQQLTARITEVAADVEEHLDVDVLTRVEEVRLAQKMDQAMQAYAAGDSAQAQEMLQRETSRSRKVRDQYGIQSDRLDQIEGSYRRSERTIQSAPPSSAEGRRMQMEQSEETFEIFLH